MTAPRRALIVIDAQRDYFQGPLAIQHPPREQSLANILAALETAEREGIPSVLVQHEFPEGAPVFAAGSEGQRLQPDVERWADRASARAVKSLASVFTAEGVLDRLREQEIDTVTLVGYMTNNCLIGSAAAAEPLGLAVEVLSDATGAIHLANDAGSASARQIHDTLMVLLHSNWAAVAETSAWAAAVADGRPLARGDLGASAVQGAAAFA
jgi:nicotinamidase-related amidase